MRPSHESAPEAVGPTGAQRKHNTGNHHKRLGALVAIQNWKWLAGYELEEGRVKGYAYIGCAA
jgi:hypothetical protein